MTVLAAEGEGQGATRITTARGATWCRREGGRIRSRDARPLQFQRTRSPARAARWHGGVVETRTHHTVRPGHAVDAMTAPLPRRDRVWSRAWLTAIDPRPDPAPPTAHRGGSGQADGDRARCGGPGVVVSRETVFEAAGSPESRRRRRQGFPTARRVRCRAASP